MAQLAQEEAHIDAERKGEQTSVAAPQTATGPPTSAFGPSSSSSTTATKICDLEETHPDGMWSPQAMLGAQQQRTTAVGLSIASGSSEQQPPQNNMKDKNQSDALEEAQFGAVIAASKLEHGLPASVGSGRDKQLAQGTQVCCRCLGVYPEDEMRSSKTSMSFKCKKCNVVDTVIPNGQNM